MLKIRKLTVKDRLSVYEILQQDEILRPGEINTTMTRIDDYLFNKNDRRNRAIVVEDENAKILGYAGYGYDEQAIGTYNIYRIAISPIMESQKVKEELIFNIELDILKNGGRLIVVKTPSHEKYESIRDIYLKHHYHLSTSIKDYYATGIDQLILIKNLDVANALKSKDNLVNYT